MNPSDNTDKVLSRRLAGGTTVILKYPTAEAHAMRSLVESIALKGFRKAPLAVIARRAMRLYLSRLEAMRVSRPDLFILELAELEKLVTPVPKPAVKSRRKGSQ